jgi:hypothetical protein
MTYAVLVRIDAAGAWPVVAGPDTDLRGEEGARWRFVAETDDIDEAYRLHALLHEKRERGEL